MSTVKTDDCPNCENGTVTIKRSSKSIPVGRQASEGPMEYVEDEDMSVKCDSCNYHRVDVAGF